MKQQKRYTAQEPTAPDGKHASHEHKSSKRKDKANVRSHKKSKQHVSVMQQGYMPVAQP